MAPSTSTSIFRDSLEAALRHALAYLENLDAAPVAPVALLEDLRARMAHPLSDDGVPSTRVIEELLADTAGGIMGNASGRFYAWVVGGVLPSALAADWLTSTWDQNAGIYASGPAAALAEEIAGGWLKDLLGLPASASFAFVTGCQMAHVTCLAAARHGVLERAGWDVEAQGLAGGPPIRIYASRERHGSVKRAVRLLGLGTENLLGLDTDEQGRLTPEALEQALATNPGAPSIVVLQAGELNTGVFDPIESLIPVARRYNAWVHIDGAFGLWAGASPRFRHLVAGVAQADSWATDGHKWLNVPYDCGYAFVADPNAQRAAMGYQASYLVFDSASRDQIDWNPEWSRRARGFSTYAAIRELGRRGVAKVVENCCEHARALTLGIGGLPGAEVLWTPVINQGLVRFLDPAGVDHDRRTDGVIAAIQASGEAYFGGVTWRGQRAMRISVCNWLTAEHDVERVVAAFARILSAPGQ
ncbi:MAG TPA: aminotransferase class V-fold PLP-dependent enzyme [Bryobacteraceae bacterium]|nr:aminotransferase class V-fold PLP-dependent enzyme [Bryobacteraceae bacterium]